MTTEVNLSTSAAPIEGGEEGSASAAEAMPEEGKWALAAIYGLMTSYNLSPWHMAT